MISLPLGTFLAAGSESGANIPNGVQDEVLISPGSAQSWRVLVLSLGGWWQPLVKFYQMAEVSATTLGRQRPLPDLTAPQLSLRPAAQSDFCSSHTTQGTVNSKAPRLETLKV